MGNVSFIFGLSRLPNGLQQPLILERFLHLRQELLFLPAADLYFRTIAHDDDTALTTHIFLYMQKINEERFVHAQKDIAQEPVIVEQGLGYQQRLVIREVKNRIASFRLAIHHFLQLHDGESSLRRKA